jgi:hypothetical protein
VTPPTSPLLSLSLPCEEGPRRSGPLPDPAASSFGCCGRPCTTPPSASSCRRPARPSQTTWASSRRHSTRFPSSSRAPFVAGTLRELSVGLCGGNFLMCSVSRGMLVRVSGRVGTLRPGWLRPRTKLENSRSPCLAAVCRPRFSKTLCMEPM